MTAREGRGRLDQALLVEGYPHALRPSFIMVSSLTRCALWNVMGMLLVRPRKKQWASYMPGVGGSGTISYSTGIGPRLLATRGLMNSQIAGF